MGVNMIGHTPGGKVPPEPTTEAQKATRKRRKKK